MMVDEGAADIVIVGTLFDKNDRPPPPPPPTTDTDWLKSNWFKKSAAERDAVADRESLDDAVVDDTALKREEEEGAFFGTGTACRLRDPA